MEPARNPTLEARIAANPDDPDAYLVYADFLQSHNDPRGELIMLQHRGKYVEAKAFITEHADYFLGPLKRYRLAFDIDDRECFDWHLGFIRSASIGYDNNIVSDVLVKLGEEVEEDDVTIPDLIEKLFKHPSGMFLRHLTVRVNMLSDGCYFAPVAKAIAATGHPVLQSLRLGEFSHAGPRGPTSEYNYEVSWTSFGDLSGLWAALPNLESFIAQGCMGPYAEDIAQFGKIVAPRLTHFEVLSGGIQQENILAFANAEWPELRYLDIWFGSSSYGYTGGGVADIQPILDGVGLPKLKHLGLMNAELTNAFCFALPGSKILPQLEELSLALGTMNDRGAQALAAEKEKLAHLKVLDLESNYLSAEGMTLVDKICADVRLDDQREPDEDEDEDEENGEGSGGRYVSVGE